MHTKERRVMGVHARGNFTGIHIQPAARRRVLERATEGRTEERGT